MDIDRDALTKLALDLFEASMLWGRGDDIPEPNIEVFVGAVLALVRPVEGVVIEPPYQAAVHKLLWTALLPDTDLTLQERTEGEYFLAALAARLEGC